MWRNCATGLAKRIMVKAPSKKVRVSLIKYILNDIGFEDQFYK